VDQVAVYSQVDATEAASDVLTNLRAGAIDYVTLTSSNIAHSLLRALDAATLDQIKARRIQIVTISPVTSLSVRELGVPVAAEATTYTTDGLVEALVDLANRGK
jgi:uroporphyrinogen III methyltransferase/synthase